MRLGKIELAISNLETIKGIVEVSIDTMLDREQRQLVDMIYVKNMSWQQICDNQSIDKKYLLCSEKRYRESISLVF